MNEAEIQPDSGSAILLTPEGFQSLKVELDNLTLVKRPEIAGRIRESQQHGEFSEDNSELDEVKVEQAMVESRIAELKMVLGNAQVLDRDRIPIDHVGIGSKVSLHDDEFADSFDVRLVTSIEANPDKDLLSSESPMGSALLGHKKGDAVQFDAPDGKKTIRITDIKR